MSDAAAAPASTIRDQRIAIAGGGIGGLSLALALARRGMLSVVYERMPEAALRSEGVFLTLAPNGINALRALGVAETVAAAGLDTAGLAIHNEHGRRLATIDYGRHAALFGAPSITIRRGILGGLLLDAAQRAGVELRLGSGITGASQDAAGVQVTTAVGTDRFACLMAADGLRSTVRNLLFPGLPQPRYTGLVGAGGWIELPEVAPTDGVMMMTFGRRAFFGYLKLGSQPVYWFNSYPAAEPGSGSVREPEAYARFIADLHRDDPLDNSRITGAIGRIERCYPIYDMPVLPAWSTGRVALLGDAAHAVAPHSGQGASMAIEDAVVLAALLAQTADPAEAFHPFERLRRERCGRAIEIGRMSGAQKHAQSWLALRMRDAILPLVMPMAVKAQEAMYRFRADIAPLSVPRR